MLPGTFDMKCQHMPDDKHSVLLMYAKTTSGAYVEFQWYTKALSKLNF